MLPSDRDLVSTVGRRMTRMTILTKTLVNQLADHWEFEAKVALVERKVLVDFIDRTYKVMSSSGLKIEQEVYDGR